MLAIVALICVNLFIVIFGCAEITMKLNDVRLDIIDYINRKVKYMNCVVCGNQLCKYQSEGKCNRMVLTIDEEGHCVRFAPKPEFEHFYEGQMQIAQDPVQKITKAVPRNFVGWVDTFIEKDEVDKEDE